MSPTQNGDPTVVKSQQSKIETIRNWSISTYKCTKQLMFEKLGKTSRTVDTGKFSLVFFFKLCNLGDSVSQQFTYIQIINGKKNISTVNMMSLST